MSDELIALCQSDAGTARLRAILAHADDELTLATDGLPIVVRIAVQGACDTRVGLTHDGKVLWPLGGNDAADVEIRGDRHRVSAFLLGEGTVTEAMLDGLVVVRPDFVGVARLSRIRSVVAARLASLLGQTAFVFLSSRRLRRRFGLDSITATSIAERLFPAVAALATSVGSLAAPAAVEIRTASFAAHVNDEDIALALPAAVRPDGDRLVGVGGRELRTPRTPHGPSTTAPPSDSRQPVVIEVEATTPRPTGEAKDSAGIELRCKATKVACEALDRAAAVTGVAAP